MTENEMKKKLDDFIVYVKSLWNRIDRDKSFWYQCNDSTRAWLWRIKKPQYKSLGANGVKLIAQNPSYYLPKELKWIENNKKDPNQVPKIWDIVIFSIPSKTGHIAIVYDAPKLLNQIIVHEQNAGSGNWDWKWENACRLKMKTYRNILWRISCNS